VAPGKLGGHRKPVLLPEREWLLARVAAEPDLTLRGLLAELVERGVKASYGALWLFLEREGLSFKKKPVRQRAGPAADRAAAGAVEEVSKSA
jgi:transposase